MQPKKSHCELSQIVSTRTNGEPSCATQGIRSLSFQRRQFPLHGVDQIGSRAASDRTIGPLELISFPAAGIFPDETLKARHFNVICLADQSRTNRLLILLDLR